jgi:hypothetical protein
MIPEDIQPVEMIVEGKRKGWQSSEFAHGGLKPIEKSREIVQVPDMGVFNNGGIIVKMERVVEGVEVKENGKGQDEGNGND